MALTVGETARLAGVTVRTLHHYDALGLVCPSGRTRAGYRLYDRADLERLQQVLAWRALGLGLEEVAAALDGPPAERLALLRAHRDRLTARHAEVAGQLAAVDAAIASATNHLEGGTMPEEPLFGGFDPEAHAAEAEARWGDTRAWKHAKRRTDRYTDDDWRRITAEADGIARELGALHAAGTPSTDPAALDLAEAHRRHVDRWFYPCSHEQHAALADMYVEDDRFTAWWDRFGDGLAGFVQEAVLANGLRSG